MPPNTAGDHRITSSPSLSAAAEPTMPQSRRNALCHTSVSTRGVTHSPCVHHTVSRLALSLSLSSSERADVSQNRTKAPLVFFSSLHHITPHHQNTNTPWCVVLAGVGVWCVPRAAMLRSHRHVPLWTPQHNNRAPCIVVLPLWVPLDCHRVTLSHNFVVCLSTTAVINSASSSVMTTSPEKKSHTCGVVRHHQQSLTKRKSRELDRQR